MSWLAVVVLVAGTGLAAAGGSQPERVRLLLRSPRGRAGDLRPLVSVGRTLAGLVGRSVTDQAARRIGWLVLGGALAVAVHPVVGVVPAAVAFVVPVVRRRRDRKAHDRALLEGLPDVVDLLALAAGAGMSVRSAIDVVTDQVAGPVIDALAAARAGVDRGSRLADALESAASALEPHGRPLIAALVASERYGEPLVPALAVVARDLRILRQRSAEESARRLPVKLIFPLVCCNLPAFVLLTLVPLLAGSLQGLLA